MIYWMINGGGGTACVRGVIFTTQVNHTRDTMLAGVVNREPDFRFFFKDVNHLPALFCEEQYSVL